MPGTASQSYPGNYNSPVLNDPRTGAVSGADFDSDNSDPGCACSHVKDSEYTFSIPLVGNSSTETITFTGPTTGVGGSPPEYYGLQTVKVTLLRIPAAGPWHPNRR